MEVWKNSTPILLWQLKGPSLNRINPGCYFRATAAEVGPCRHTLKTEIFQKYIQKNFKTKIQKYHSIELQRKNNSWNFCWFIPRGCLIMAIFRLKKAHFQIEISRYKIAGLVRDYHQWKAWTFYFMAIPHIYLRRTNPWPRNCAWKRSCQKETFSIF